MCVCVLVCRSNGWAFESVFEYGDVLGKLGAVMTELGRWTMAEASIRRALAHYDANQGNLPNVDAAKFQTNLAQVLEEPVLRKLKMWHCVVQHNTPNLC